MPLVTIDSRDKTPIYTQLERALRAAIATGRLKPGDQLPTVRSLAVELAVNANTVARVYAELERGGVIETRRGGWSPRTRAAALPNPPAGLARKPPRRNRPARRASMRNGCAPLRRACSPRRRPMGSVWTKWFARSARIRVEAPKK